MRLEGVRIVLMKDANFGYLKNFMRGNSYSIIKGCILDVADSHKEAVAGHGFLEREKTTL